MVTTVRVWDLPTRIFHWSLVLCVLALAITGHAPGSWVEWHARFGYAVLALVGFRLVWGLVGGRWSRFSTFLVSPRGILRYLRGHAHPDHLVGHNPLGGLSVLAMLLLVLVQVGTGLVSDDEIAFQGPLNRLVSASVGLSATWYHKQIGQWILLALVVLHIAAVLFYLWRRGENLVRPMLGGDKELDFAAQPARDDAKARLAAAGLLLACSTLVWWLVRSPAGG